MMEYPDILTLRITQADIDKAKEARVLNNRPSNCPIAQSLHRRGYTSAWAGFEFVHMEDDDYTRYEYSDAARQFFRMADIMGDEHVSPQTFKFRKVVDDDELS